LQVASLEKSPCFPCIFLNFVTRGTSPVLDSDRPEWQLPEGVSRGTWDYFGLKSIATDYDTYFRDHPLLTLDVQWVRERLKQNTAISNFNPSISTPSVSGPVHTEPGHSTSRPVIADLGCGTARALTALASTGAHLVAVDMSQNMLEEAAAKLKTFENPYSCLRMNLVHMEGLRDQSIDVAVCLFSSFGMIKGDEFRKQALREVQRVLKPNGEFLLHVHNIWSSLRDPGGLRWLAASYLRSWYDRHWEWGDRIYVYRGLPKMFLHSFSIGRLKRDLQQAGFKVDEVRYLNIQSADYIQKNTAMGRLTAGGFFIAAKKQGP
jgi:ubiquinone/menaquinone biosynthesis C-methylase UbiE